MSEISPQQERMKENLARTSEIIDAVFALKLAWMRTKHPEFSDEQAERQVCLDVLRRKERQWTSPVA